ncbi:EAL and HDOD domain-containing protein [Halobacillus sp. BBL2006]|uniref:EAL and HDOD domain-containing protein n=1 Tax=Halobacillus sp. BBL2006 TaxID=1543706 RepID=UPI0005432D27|nr:HDOD domain-containing protein [Halobacillus sp. BBL2006]KHE67767.1 diguanylate phosphodiesterase [Halobacillus sp. BBL2006]
MEVFVARQPILKANEEVYAYELLYRNSKDNRFTPIDPNQATSEVLMNSFLTIGLRRLSQNKPCFINFTEDLLLEKVPEYFDPQQLVVEILEHVSYSMGLIRVCRELKRQGFLIALDDIVSVEESSIIELLQYIDILKVDIREVNDKDRKEIINLAKRFNITLLAEKVETRDEHQTCLAEGFELFQGYYYSKPVVISGMDIPFLASTYFQIIKELSVGAKEVNIDKVTEILEQDVALTYKLLRLINSSMYQRTVPVKSIKQAVMLLGTDTLEKWLYVLSVKQTSSFSSTSTQLVLKTSLLRAKMSEQLSIRLRTTNKAEGFFLTGFLSLIDVITKRPVTEIIESLPLDTNIKVALEGKRNFYRDILDTVMAMEKADFEELEDRLIELELGFDEIFEIYGQAIAWTDQLYQENFSDLVHE